MRITDVRVKTVPVAAAMRNADISYDAMTASALVVLTDQIIDGRPLAGLAFDSIGRYGHTALLEERFIPRLLAAAPEDYLDRGTGSIDPAKIWGILMRNEKPGGHGERPGAVGLIDAAVWDLVAKSEGLPLWRLLDRRFGSGGASGRVPVYASGGHYRPDGDTKVLVDEVRRYIDHGYGRVKIKIGGASLAEDLRRIDAVTEALGGGDRLAVDGNGTFDAETAKKYAEALAHFDLAWIEEPVPPLDYEAHRAFRAIYPGPLGTGENIFSAADTRNLLRYAGLDPARDWLQMDISLSYGIVEYLRILDLMAEEGWSRARCMPHAGHLLSLHAVAGLGLGAHEAAPDPSLPFGGLPEDATLGAGYVNVGDTPGVGIERKPNLYAVFRDMCD